MHSEPELDQLSQDEKGSGPRRLDARDRALTYAWVTRRVEADIATGYLASGERLAAERALSERYQVARNTLRRALTELEHRGVLEVRGRSGWYVRPREVTETINRPQGLTEWAERHGLTASSRSCTGVVRPAYEGEARALGIPVGTHVFQLERVRLIDGIPLSLDVSVLAPRLAPLLSSIDFSTRSLYETIRQLTHIEPTRSECLLRASRADQRVARLLEVDAGSPLLELSETVFDQYGAPYEFATLLNRGDRYAFRTTVTARGGGWIDLPTDPDRPHRTRSRNRDG
jgi:GntR family transcriptional regulator